MVIRKGCVAFLLILCGCLFLPVAASSQAYPEFRLGFRTLAEMIDGDVGIALEDEHYGPNGDSLQQTTTGLMVWRKADNWTAFTNGARTWINGPLGLQQRGNDERFDWEIGPTGQYPVAGSSVTPSPPPSVVSSPGPSSSVAVPTPTPTSAPVGIRSPEPAGSWVTSLSPTTKYYTSRSSSYWQSWSPANRIWFTTEAGLLAAYPGRTRR